MVLVDGKDSTITVETPSVPLASSNQGPNLPKAKCEIVKETVNNSVVSASRLNNTPPPVQGKKKIVKKKIVKKKIIIKKKKEDVPSGDGGDVKQELALAGEQSKNNLENSKEKSGIGNKILRKTEVDKNDSGNKMLDKKEELQSIDDGDMKQKNVVVGEQSKRNLETSKEKSEDRVDCQDFNADLKQKENGKNNNVNSKKKVIVVRKKVNSNNKEGSQALMTEDLKAKNVISSGNSKRRPEDVKNKVENDEKNRKNFGGSSNKRHKENTEDRNGLSSNPKPKQRNNKVEHDEKNRENFGGSSNKRHKEISEDRNGLSSNPKPKQRNEERPSYEQTRKEEGKKHQREGERRENRNKKVGGVIFFCSSKTKPDCFRYNIMGVSANRQDIVLSIKPGMKLFLYDFALKLFYGIYRATSPGGMNLEPAAFGGNFPVQVRFEIYQDCNPLPESVFKRAIEENYSGNNKFDPELTYQQVNRLMVLFKPAEIKNQVSPPIYPPQVNVSREEPKERETVYLSHHHRESSAREPYNYDERRRYDLHVNETDKRLAYRRAPSPQRETSPEKLFLSEKDYRTHGLRRERRNVSPPRSHIAPTLELDSRSQGPLTVHPRSTYRYGENEYPTPHSQLPRQELHSSPPYENPSTASIVDSYLKVPYYGSSSNPYQPPLRREREEVALGSYSLGRRETTYQSEPSYLPRREIYSSQTRHYLTEASHVGRRENHDVGSLYSSYASKALSEYNQQHTSEGNKPQTSFSTVSARYSFAGPSR